eukprot:1129226-Prorocentrum_minimum.AAC.3
MSGTLSVSLSATGRRELGCKRGCAMQLYEALGLDGHSCPTDAQIRKSYHALCRQYHPDKLGHLDPAAVAAATAKFHTIQAAFLALSGPDQSGWVKQPNLKLARTLNSPLSDMRLHHGRLEASSVEVTHGTVGEMMTLSGEVTAVRWIGHSLIFATLILVEVLLCIKGFAQGFDQGWFGVLQKMTWEACAIFNAASNLVVNPNSSFLGSYQESNTSQQIVFDAKFFGASADDENTAKGDAKEEQLGDSPDLCATNLSDSSSGWRAFPPSRRDVAKGDTGKPPIVHFEGTNTLYQR